VVKDLAIGTAEQQSVSIAFVLHGALYVNCS